MFVNRFNGWVMQDQSKSMEQSISLNNCTGTHLLNIPSMAEGLFLWASFFQLMKNITFFSFKSETCNTCLNKLIGMKWSCTWFTLVQTPKLITRLQLLVFSIKLESQIVFYPRWVFFSVLSLFFLYSKITYSNHSKYYLFKKNELKSW